MSSEANPETLKVMGNALLRDALLEGDKRLAEMALDLGANVEEPMLWGIVNTPKGPMNRFFHPLVFAVTVKNINPEIVGLLLSRRSDPNAYLLGESPPLHRAANRGSQEVAKMLIDAGADVNFQDRAGNTPLSYATFTGDNDTIDLLIKSGAHVNTTNVKGNTPLLTALHKGYFDTAELLVIAGANVNAYDAEGETPLLLAVRGDDFRTSTLLLLKNADPNAENKHKETALILAASNENLYIMKEILKKKEVNVNAQDLLGNTALILAAISGDANMCRALLDAGANQNLADKSGSSAYNYVQLSEYKDTLVPLFKQYQLAALERGEHTRPNAAHKKIAN